MKKFDGYLSRITSFLDGAYSQGYTDGYDKAKTLFGKHDRGVAHFQRATEEEINEEVTHWMPLPLPPKGGNMQ